MKLDKYNELDLLKYIIKSQRDTIAFLEKDDMQERQERDQLYQEKAMLILEKEGLEDEMDKLKKDANILKCGISELREMSVRSGRRSTKEE